MTLEGKQREILRKGILGAYPSEDKLVMLMLEKMDFKLEQVSRGEGYETRVFNLITDLEADGTLNDFIEWIIEDKPNSPYLKEVRSAFNKDIKDDKLEPQGRYALVVSINTYNSLGKLEAPADSSETIAKLLETYGEFHVSRLPETKDMPVTLSQLKIALGQLFKPERGNIPETALFYFSGRGIREMLIGGAFLAASDCDPDNEKWGIGLKDMQELLRSSHVKEQIIWLDCCGENLNFNDANPGEQEGISRCFIGALGNFELSKVLSEGLDPRRYSQKEVTNTSLTGYLENRLKGATITNFGSAIALTRRKDSGRGRRNQRRNNIQPQSRLQSLTKECNHQTPLTTASLNYTQ